MPFDQSPLKRAFSFGHSSRVPKRNLNQQKETQVIYIMNSAVMPAGCFGTYSYSPATVYTLVEVVNDVYGKWQSAIGYEQNLDLIEEWTAYRIPLNRTETVFKDGDSALVMRLKRRVADPTTKGAPVSSNPEDWEFAWVEFSA